jgi:hypothetical protein
MMSKLLFAIFLASLAFAFTTGKQQEQPTEYNQQAEIDAKGNIYVSSDQGKLIWMADSKHCSEASEANDHQTLFVELWKIRTVPIPWNRIVSKSIGKAAIKKSLNRADQLENGIFRKPVTK